MQHLASYDKLSLSSRPEGKLTMNWTECPVVEVVPGKLSGAPLIVHSRVRPEDLVTNRPEGLEWLAENYDLPVDTVRTVLAFYEHKMGRVAHPV